MSTRLITQIAAGERLLTVRSAIRRKGFVLIGSSRMLGLVDQGVVSSTNFATTVAIGRLASPEELGAYALGMSLMIFATNVQHSLIGIPYTLRCHDKAAHGLGAPGPWLLSALLLSVGTAGAIAVIGLIFTAVHSGSRVAAVILTLAAVVPLVLLRDLARDFCFARLRLREVMVFDIAVSIAQLTALAGLAFADRLNAVNALLAIGLVCGTASVIAVVVLRLAASMRVADVPDALREGWLQGKWLLGSLLGLVVQVQSSYWFVAALAGTRATGVFAACMSVAALANPLISGLANTALARGTRAYRAHGIDRLKEATWRDMGVHAAVMGLFCLIVIAAGGETMRLLFGRPDYAGSESVVALLALWQTLHAVGIPLANGLIIVDRARTNFIIATAGTIVSAVVTAAAAGPWGSIGAAFGLLAGTGLRMPARLYVFCHATRKDWR